MKHASSHHRAISAWQNPGVRASLGLFAFMFCIILSVTLLSGCQIVGVITDKTPTEIPAEYQIENRPTLVLVEDPDNLSPYGTVPSTVAGNIEFNLINSGAVSQANIVSREAVAELKADNPDFHRWSAAKIGLMAGAQQVIFVKITEFQLTEAQLVYRPTIAGDVRLVDTRQNKVIWPGQREGHPVRDRLFYQNTDIGETVRDLQYAEEVAAKLGVSIGRLFHVWIEPVERDTGNMGE